MLVVSILSFSNDVVFFFQSMDFLKKKGYRIFRQCKMSSCVRIESAHFLCHFFSYLPGISNCNCTRHKAVIEPYSVKRGLIEFANKIDRNTMLTLSQTMNFRLFQTERVCRWQFQIWWKWQKTFQMGRKYCGKRRNCSLRAISPFPAVFSKDLNCRHVKN